MICHVSTGSSLSALSALWDVLQCCPGQDSSLRRRKASATEEGDAAEEGLMGVGVGGRDGVANQMVELRFWLITWWIATNDDLSFLGLQIDLAWLRDLHVQQCYFLMRKRKVDDGRCCIQAQFPHVSIAAFLLKLLQLRNQNHRRIPLSITFPGQEKWRSYLQKPAQEVKLKVHAASQLWSWNVPNPGFLRSFEPGFFCFIFSTDIIRIVFTFLGLHVKAIRSWNGMFWGLWRRDTYAKGLGLPSVVIARGKGGTASRQGANLNGTPEDPNQQSHQSNGSNVSSSKRSIQIGSFVLFSEAIYISSWKC